MCSVSTRLQFQHLVAVVAYRKTVCYEDYRLFSCGEDVCQQLTFSLCVKSRRRFVEEHDGTVSQQGTRYGDALCLTFRESSATFGARCVKTVGEVEDKFRTALPQCLLHLLRCCVRLSEQQVVAYCAGHESIALRYVDEIAAVEVCHFLLLFR